MQTRRASAKAAVIWYIPTQSRRAGGERTDSRSVATDQAIFAHKISGLFLPRKRGEPPALTMLRATPFPAPASHRKRPGDKKGAPKRTLGRIESHRPRLTRPHVAKKSPATAEQDLALLR